MILTIDDDIHSAVWFVTKAMAGPSRRWNMNHLVFRRNTGRLIATDGHRMHWVETEAIKERFTEDACFRVFSDDRTAEVALISVEKPDKYPDVEGVIPEDYATRAVDSYCRQFPEGFGANLRYVADILPDCRFFALGEQPTDPILFRDEREHAEKFALLMGVRL